MHLTKSHLVVFALEGNWQKIQIEWLRQQFWHFERVAQRLWRLMSAGACFWQLIPKSKHNGTALRATTTFTMTAQCARSHGNTRRSICFWIISALARWVARATHKNELTCILHAALTTCSRPQCGISRREGWNFNGLGFHWLRLGIALPRRENAVKMMAIFVISVFLLELVFSS